MNHKTTVVLIASASILIALLLFTLWYKSYSYSIDRVITLDNARLDVQHDVAPSIDSAKHFVEQMVTEYRADLAELSPSFKKDIRLWEAKGISAKFVFSTFAESLLYLFPADDNVMYVDLVHVPVQTAFLHGMINLETPKHQVDRSQLTIVIPFDEAVQRYKSEQAQITTMGSSFMFGGPEEGTVQFNDRDKMFTFIGKSITGFYKPRIKVNNTASWYSAMFGRTSVFEIKIKGPLLFSSEKDFSWTDTEGKHIGRQMAEADIRNLSTASEFFRQSSAHPKLKPLADAILEKKNHVEKDSSFDYPLWQQDKDMKELRELAKPFNIEGSYIDRLLERQSRFSSGFLLWYFRDAWEFMWQWIVINSIFLVGLIPAYLFRDRLPLLIRQSLGLYGPVLVLSTNTLVFTTVRPEQVSLPYWLLPGILCAMDICLCIIIDLKGVRARIKKGETLWKSPMAAP